MIIRIIVVNVEVEETCNIQILSCIHSNKFKKDVVKKKASTSGCRSLAELP
jgi:hypothetical protein